MEMESEVNIEIKRLTEEQAKEWLRKLIHELDRLDAEDFFGTEGWRHHLGFEE